MDEKVVEERVFFHENYHHEITSRLHQEDAKERNRWALEEGAPST